MKLTRNRHYETLTYIGLWLLVIALYMLVTIRNRSMDSLTPVNEEIFVRMAMTLLPFVVLFTIHNCLIIPRLLFRNRLPAYFMCTLLALALVWSYQYFHFMHEISTRPVRHPMPPMPHHLLPLPLFLDFLLSLLIIGANLVIALLFQRFADRLERESLMKANAENQLSYLKAQINPHFYMNMLNNIHGLIEIDPDKAQDMVIDMSRLMRYMLYECSQPRISLSAEIEFLDNYLRLMRQRYPSDKVVITNDFPDRLHTTGVMVPPLIFLVFIENAFKHGITYREESFVSVSIRIADGKVEFHCLNSNHPSASPHTPGIGLTNVEQRLNLIYGPGHSLETIASDTSYKVNLIIPVHETPDSNN